MVNCLCLTPPHFSIIISWQMFYYSQSFLNFINYCSESKMLDPSSFSLPKNRWHNLVFDQGGKCFQGNSGGHILCLGPIFSQSFRFNFTGPTKGETKDSQKEFTYLLTIFFIVIFHNRSCVCGYCADEMWLCLFDDFFLHMQWLLSTVWFKY